MWVTGSLCLLLAGVHYWIQRQPSGWDQVLLDSMTRGLNLRLSASWLAHFIHYEGMHLAVNLITFLSLRELEEIYGSSAYLGLLLCFTLLVSGGEELMAKLSQWWSPDHYVEFAHGWSGINCALEVLSCYYLPTGYFFGSPQPRIYDLVGKLMISHLAMSQLSLRSHLVGLTLGGIGYLLASGFILPVGV